MKNDARFFLNKKKLRNKLPDKGGGRTKKGGRQKSLSTIDARKILNSKRAGKVLKKGSFNTNSQFIKKQFSSQPVASNKHIEVSKDGNIWVTAKSFGASSSIKPTTRKNVNQSPMKTKFQWRHVDVKDDDLEHIGLGDILDIDSLPSAVPSTKVSLPRQESPIVRRSLAEEVIHMKNTMIADEMTAGIYTQSAQVAVSNLCSTVSKQDLMDLFGHVGAVKSIQVLQPGTAFVEFYDKVDAAKACDFYHNRLLDGQAMKCYLQPSTPSQRMTISQRLGERVFEESPSTSRAAYVPHPRSRLNPNNVHFTVKLV